MAVETESTKNQPVDIKSDLFKIEHQWAYLNNKLLSDILSSIRVPEQTLVVKVLHYLCFCLHLKTTGQIIAEAVPNDIVVSNAKPLYLNHILVHVV
jgi:hypothetical protein